jgi:hypothetical protein
LNFVHWLLLVAFVHKFGALGQARACAKRAARNQNRLDSKHYQQLTEIRQSALK